MGGLVLMFGPALWLVGSSFKSPAQLAEFPPTLLPYVSRTAVVPGHDKPLPLFVVKMETGETRELAEIRRIGIVAQMVDPAKPGEIIRVNIQNRTPAREIGLATGQLHRAFRPFRLPAISVRTRSS